MASLILPKMLTDLAPESLLMHVNSLSLWAVPNAADRIGWLPMLATVLSILMLAAIALVAGAVWLWRKPGMRRQSLLMLVLAAVALVNVGIWTVPDGKGRSPAGQISE